MKYNIYYNPRLDILGLLVTRNYVRIYLHEGMRIFMYNTGEWINIGNL